MSTEPYEIIAAPFEVYVAPVGESFPAIDATPAGNWVKLGTNGSKNMDESGAVVKHPQTVDLFRVYGSTGPVKAVRSSEDLMVSFTLLDLTLEEYTEIIDDVTVTDTAAGSGTAGYREINLRRGLDVAQIALLVRGPSPYGDGWNMDYRLPRVVQTGSPTPTFVKNAPAGLAFEYTVIEDQDAATDAERMGTLRAQDAAALP